MRLLKLLLAGIGLSVLLLSGCFPDDRDKVFYNVTFDSKGGNDIPAQRIEEGNLIEEPDDPEKDGFVFLYWYSDDENVSFSFETVITSDIILSAAYEEEKGAIIDYNKLIEEDFSEVEQNLFLSKYEVSLPARGRINNSTILWSSSSKYLKTNGLILPVVNNEEESAVLTGVFSLKGVTVTKKITVPLIQDYEAEISVSKEVPFKNLTTEYDVKDGNLELFFETDGSVPYVSVTDFFSLLEGFIDPAVEFTVDKNADLLEITYYYYDETEDHTYTLTCSINADTNKITTNDPGFFWAYVYSTATNYGRHIVYDYDNPENYYTEGSDVIYDLGLYNLDIVYYEGEVLLPLYITNQIFAGSSYYNVYYNYDSLYGIYSLPSVGSDEYETIRNSSKSNGIVPADLVIHTFNMLAFDMDYFYGLKDIMEVDTYYDQLFAKSSRLLNKNAKSIDDAISEFLLKSIDEPHTSYGSPSYYNNKNYDGPENGSLSDYGPRFNEYYMDGLYAVDDAIIAKWGIKSNNWAAYDDKRPNYWFLDDESAVLILDGFNTMDIDESDTYDKTIVESIMNVSDANLLLPDITGGNKFFYYNESSKENNVLEVIVKGIDETYLETYRDKLLDFGYVFVSEESDDEYKQNGYYKYTLNDKNYMLQTTYDEAFGLFYFGIADFVPDNYEDDWMFFVDIDWMIESDSAVYMEFMMESILKEKPSIKNVVIDLTWNGGGNVGALYRILGFITDAPFMVSSIDRDTGSCSSTHIKIEGVPNYKELNWSLLTSLATFSAANEMATIFKENNLGKIMGVKSGGGACSITPILLPNGTAFTMSSNNINASRMVTSAPENPYEYISNEFGVDVDYEIDIENIYDNDILLEILGS